MRYHIQEYGHSSVLFLKDDLTFHDIQDLGALLYKEVRETNGALIVDMRNVPSMDITITGQFVAAHREAKSLRREFVVANVCPSVLNTLIAGQVNNLVQIYPTTQEAIADIEERARGGVARKFIPEIKCGHDDCVYFTYARYREQITQACQYPFPDEVINDPTCRCYRMNWNQRKNDAQNVEVPLQMGKKKSLYEIRDKAARENNPTEEADGKKPQAQEETPTPQPQPVVPPRVVRGSNNHPVEARPHHSPQIHTPSHAAPATPHASIAPIASPDPFADDNFPHTQVPASIPRPAPAHGYDVARTEAETHAIHGDHPGRTGTEPRNQTPEETVRHYVESWNDGRFAAEYRSLSKKSRVLPLEEYCQRRRSLQATQIQSQGKSTRQEIGKFDSVSIDGEHAHVEITRIDRGATGTHCYAEHFTLIHEDGEWRIKSLRQGEERRNPITPPRGRVMKADDFLGREQHLKRHHSTTTERE